MSVSLKQIIFRDILLKRKKFTRSTYFHWNCNADLKFLLNQNQVLSLNIKIYP